MNMNLKQPYSKLIDDIDNAPKTYLPGMLIRIIQACERNKVFRDGGLLEVVKKVQNSKESK